MKFHEKVDLYMRRRGLNQSELGRATGLPPTRISELLIGKYQGTTEARLRIARALGVTLDYLVDPEMAEPTPSLSAGEQLVLHAMSTLGVDPDAVVQAILHMARPGEGSGEQAEAAQAARKNGRRA